MEMEMEMEGEVVKSRFKRVCVFCGSRTGKRKCYTDVAVELGQELVARSLDLVYGGGSIRLMGIVSKTVHRAGGNGIRWVWNFGGATGSDNLGSA
ncbi:hypothetical protein Goarm_018835, partial [Gossypium armourianum]|nr:hypothetical protein [Gossypium armourianum]